MTLVERLRQRAGLVYLTADAKGPADDLSKHLREAADHIEALEREVAALRPSPVPMSANEQARWLRALDKEEKR